MATIQIDEKSLKKKIKLKIEEKGDLSRLKQKSLKEIADVLLKEIKRRIAQGISPITGKRFPAYKDPKKYPAKKKPQRPVNLYLSGDFLRSLVAKIKAGKNPAITVTFDDTTSEKKELGHRTGAKGQRKRPIVPQGNEGFTDSILVAVRQVFRKVIDRDLK